MAKFEGVDSLMRKLKAITPKAVEKIEKALDQGADEIVATQKQFAPRERGALIRSIRKVKGKYTPDNPNVRGVGGSKSATGITIVAGDKTAFYAAFVEFGTAPHKIRPKPGKSLVVAGKVLPPDVAIDHPGSKPHPFFYPGYRINKRRVKSRITRAVKAAAKEAAGR